MTGADLYVGSALTGQRVAMRFCPLCLSWRRAAGFEEHVRLERERQLRGVQEAEEAMRATAERKATR